MLLYGVHYYIYSLLFELIYSYYNVNLGEFLEN